MGNPWGSIDPNSEHQLWSRWTFTVFDSGKHPPHKEVQYNAQKWLNKLFGSVGHATVIEGPHKWEIVAEVEGVPAHDPVCKKSVRRQFQKNFVDRGWGKLAIGVVDVEILAGETGAGKPRSQLIVLPTIQSPPRNWVQEPSIPVCAEQCGAKCCKGPGFLALRAEEANRLSKKNRGFKPVWEDGRWIVRWEKGEQCVFLGKDNACTIYEDRPEGCRKFPMRPFEGCLVWPA